MTQLTEYDEKIKKLTEKIAKEPENAVYYYLNRGNCYLFLEDYKKAIEDYNKAIELNPENADFYSNRGICYLFLEDYEKALEDFNNAIELDPNNAQFYLARGNYYFDLKSYKKAIEDLNKAIELGFNNAELYAGRGNCYLSSNDYKEAIEDFSKAIELDPQNTNYYSYRSEAYKNMSSYQEALKDYTILIELEPDNVRFYSNRGFCYLSSKDYRKAIEDYNKAIELDSDNADFYSNHGICYFYLQDYEKAIEDFSKAIKLAPNHAKFYLNRGNSYVLLQYYDQAIEDYNKLIELDPKNEDDYEMQKRFAFELKKKDEQIRLDERNKVIADLSHSIKNLIATVIDPLENLKNETVVQPQIIQNALRGANLIREIVNAVNLSFKGSMDDFIYDAQHNAAKDSVNLESMLIESLRQSVGNMFDSKYFGNFMRKYFPKKEQYHEAKAGWTSISQSKDLKSLEQFLKSYFFETDFSFENAKSFAIGNQKGSSVKLLILFQELILNAVKYSAFVSKEKRFLRIRFISNADTISVKVENPFDERTKTKTTGIGHVVIQNFATLLNTEPVISKENSIYCVVIQFKNLWKGNAQ